MKNTEAVAHAWGHGEFVALLVCPVCQSDLDFAKDRIYCSNPACSRSKSGFPIIKGIPALIDFDRSVVGEEYLITAAGQSTVSRGGSVWRKLSYLTSGMFGLQAAMDRRTGTFLDCVRSTVGGDRTVLIVGGGNLSPKSPFRKASDLRLVNCDIYCSAATDVLADGHFLPFRSASFDGVAAEAVLEHVLDPATVVSELRRVLKPGGIVYAETSFMQQVHEAAFDFTRFTHSGHRWLFRDFDEIQSGAADGPGNALIWSTRYLVRGLARTKLAGIFATLIVLWMRLFDRLIPEAFAIDSTSAVFFIGRKGENSLGPKDIISYYRGAGRR